MSYYSQLGQDRFLNENYFKNKADGVFVDIGAHDGNKYSNSKFFENLGWAGLCVEPILDVFDRLKQNRKCLCENYAISDTEGEDEFLLVRGYAEMLSGLSKEYDPIHLNRIKNEINYYGGDKETIKIKTLRLQTLLDKHNINNIDYLSVDTEGNELKVLKSIDFNKTKIYLITVENNYQSKNINDFLSGVGFKYVTSLDIDEIYINN